MTPERWQQINTLFHQALAQERDLDLLRRSCGADQDLYREVAQLLAAHREAGDFMAQVPATVARELLAAEAVPNLAGQRLGPYRLLRELGSGGMGAVYLAERADDQFHQFVAVKLIKPGLNTQGVLARFRNERQLLANFTHPNIARLLDGGKTDDGRPYLVMEYIAGQPLDLYCQQQQLSLRQRLELFNIVCDAVSYAHRQFVIHRDIKPSNILVTSEGGLKLLDFGIAKILKPEVGVELVATLDGVHPLTPGYASPEQLRGGPLTAASDVYSLGVVLYQLLTGHSPYAFQSCSPEGVAHGVCDIAPIPPSVALNQFLPGSPPQFLKTGVLGSLRGDLDSIILKSLATEPDQRYASVAQFSDDLRHYLTNQPVTAQSATWLYRSSKWLRRNSLVAGVVLLAAFTLLYGLGQTWVMARRAQAREQAAQAAQAEMARQLKEVQEQYRALLADQQQKARRERPPLSGK